jgi:hypothetical protein
VVKRKTRPAVTIGTPLMSMVHAMFHRSLLMMLIADSVPGDRVIDREDIQRADARNQIVEQFLSGKNDWLLWLDSDMWFPINTISRLMKHELFIVGSLYCTKGVMPTKLTSYYYDHFDEETQIHMYRSIPREIAQEAIDKHELMNVDAVGTGGMLVHRRVYEDVDYPWFSYREGGSEDMFFCRRVKEKDYTIWVDPGVQCGHCAEGLAWPMGKPPQEFMSMLNAGVV